MISVIQLGALDYATSLRLQEKLVTLRKEGRIGDILLLLEHSPVITLGRNAKAKNILASPELLAQRGVEVFECDRGGDVTFHGPGQLVAYPIFDLRGFPSQTATRNSMGVIEFARNLEEALIRTCAELGIPTKRIAGLTGVWTEASAEAPTDGCGHAHVGAGALACPAESKIRQRPQLSEAKIAALGIHVSRGVTSHGIALNVNTDLSFFDLIVPCGITSKPVTSMAKERGQSVAMQDVAHALSRHFGKVFASQMLWLDSLDHLLGDNVCTPMNLSNQFRKICGEGEAAL